MVDRSLPRGRAQDLSSLFVALLTGSEAGLRPAGVLDRFTSRRDNPSRDGSGAAKATLGRDTRRIAGIGRTEVIQNSVRKMRPACGQATISAAISGLFSTRCCNWVPDARASHVRLPSQAKPDGSRRGARSEATLRVVPRVVPRAKRRPVTRSVPAWAQAARGSFSASAMARARPTMASRRMTLGRAPKWA